MAIYRIGIDVGGTFTDLVAVDDLGRATLEKVPSTPDDPSIGVLDGLELLAQQLGCGRAALLAETDRIIHGTTVATNALLERNGARVGLLTTEGHRDVIEMREGLKDDRYNLRLPPPEQLVPRRLRLGVRERLRGDGRVETPLDPASLDQAIAVLKRERVEAVAVCYLHAWRDPSHERATREAVERELPGVYVVAVRRGIAADQGIRASLDDRGQRLCRASSIAVSGAARAAPRRGRVSRADFDHSVAWRSRTDRRGGPAGGGRRTFRAGGRCRRQRPCGAAGRRRRSDPVRHGRDQHRYLPDRRGASDPVDRPPCRRPGDRAEQPGHRQHRRRRRLDRPGR